MSTRPRRTVKKIIEHIEVSDSETDDEQKASPSRRRAQKSVDSAASAAAGITRKRRAIAKNPVAAAKKKRAKNDVENEAPNTTAPAVNASVDVAPSTSFTSGRSSFWERRKPWDIVELLAETEQIRPTAAQNIVKLFQNGDTIPFICRYRRDLVDQVTPDRLRDIRNTYTEIADLRKRSETIVGQLERTNVLNEEIRKEIMCAKTSEELEFLYAPYKPASKGTLCERAKALGLEPYADRLLYGTEPKVELSSIVDASKDALATEQKVLEGICNIIIHNISKNPSVLEELRRLQNVHHILMKCSKANTKKKTAATKTNALGSNHGENQLDSAKYENYFNFQADIKSIKPHQMLAINRAEAHKFLTVKIETNNYLKRDIIRFIVNLYLTEGLQYAFRTHVFTTTVEECFLKKLLPLLCRQVRAHLKEKAQNAAIKVFATNVKQLLLMSTLKGERILGIDPGFTNGCKLALISETADVLETNVIYPHGRHANRADAESTLSKMLAKHNCHIIALGNGTACRETEMWLTDLLRSGTLQGSNVRYSIVNENGASIYSCSSVARKEFPTMDTNEISAVSIARRLNDPLSEYVKIEPRHLGVGMYQHDVNEKTLTESLNDVVSECVSYVGVDLNTASLSVLKHIAGLSEKKAEKIIEYRTQHGPIQARKDLLLVRGIGEKSFEQCAGFVRIEPLSVGGQIKNPLDCTIVHPESYKLAESILAECDLKRSDIGKPMFIKRIKEFAEQRSTLSKLAKQHELPMKRLEFVLLALQREPLQDYRAEFNKRPLFKQGLMRLNDLSVGDVVTGAVNNVTHFGAFVDIGVERCGLIHKNNMNNVDLGVGDRVTASVVSVDVQRQKLGLRLEHMLEETDTSFTFKTESE